MPTIDSEVGVGEDSDFNVGGRGVLVDNNLNGVIDGTITEG